MGRKQEKKKVEVESEEEEQCPEADQFEIPELDEDELLQAEREEGEENLQQHEDLLEIIKSQAEEGPEG